MGGKSSAPPPPDYAAAAQQTSQGNLALAKQQQQANMVNQVTPNGKVTYTQNQGRVFNQAGYDAALASYNAQIAADPKQAASLVAPNQANFYTTGPTGQWTQTISLSPAQQAMFNQNQKINQSLGNVAQQGLGYVQGALNKPLSFDQAQALQDPGQIQQQASDAAYKNATQYLDPQFARQGAALQSQLANQGITRGSEAWNNAMQQQDAAKQQAYASAQNQAYLQGMQGANQAYNQAMGNRQQQITEAQTLQQNPLNMLNAVRSGQQMQVAQMPNAQHAPGMMGQVAGPDMMGALQGNYNARLGQVNAQNAQAAQDTSSAISAIGMAAMMY